MIAYLDTSAFVPLLVAEPASAGCRRFWDDADTVVSSRLLYVEAGAALAQARRMGRLPARTHRASLTRLDRLWAQVDVVEVSQDTVERAAALAHRLALRGDDAVHCASAERVAAPDLVAASGDRQLLAAWRKLGFMTYDSTGSGTPGN